METPASSQLPKFRWRPVNYDRNEISLMSVGDLSPPQPPPPPPMGKVLPLIEKTKWVGTGLNTVFRPDNRLSPKAILPAPVPMSNTDTLQINLTKESIEFGEHLGDVANRGFDQQEDIHLNGFTYMQLVFDVTNQVTGRGDNPPEGIHAETGFWMYVPPSFVNPDLAVPTLCRMGSIPHGTTVNAQGLDADLKAGAPDIGPRSITPTKISDPTVQERRDSQNIENIIAARLPQDLTKFVETGILTQEYLDNPSKILLSVNSQLKIEETYTWKVSTQSPAAPIPVGGGTANIAFLVGQSQPIANAIRMDNTFWLEKVSATITIDNYDASKSSQIVYVQPDFVKPATGWEPPLPTFAVALRETITTPVKIPVEYWQLQYIQIVHLNFNGLSYPHLSLATMVPSEVLHAEVPKAAKA